MTEKEINERIAMALLKCCALVWEFWTSKPKHEGDFTFKDVYDATNFLDREKDQDDAKPGKLCIEMYKCNYADTLVLRKKLSEVEGVIDYDEDFLLTLKVDTGHGNFSCQFYLANIFYNAYMWCRKNGCGGLLNKAVFGYDENGMFTILPTLKPHKAKKVSKPKVAKPQPKPQPKEPTFKERILAALDKLAADQAA